MKVRNVASHLVGLAMGLHVMLACAAPQGDQVVGPVTASAKVVLYADAEGVSPHRLLSAIDLAWPMVVVSENEDFVQLTVKGQLVWVDKAVVVIKRAVDVCQASPKTAGVMKPVTVAGSRGATNACK